MWLSIQKKYKSDTWKIQTAKSQILSQATIRNPFRNFFISYFDKMAPQSIPQQRYVNVVYIPFVSVPKWLQTELTIWINWVNPNESELIRKQLELRSVRAAWSWLAEESESASQRIKGVCIVQHEFKWHYYFWVWVTAVTLEWNLCKQVSVTPMCDTNDTFTFVKCKQKSTWL